MRLKLFGTSLLGLGLLSAPLFAQSDRQPPQPGTMNYVEGQVSVDGRPVTAGQIGNLDLQAGQELTTGAGKAEVLLTPGVFLRVGSNSAVKMVSPELMNTQVQVERGKAAFEVDEIHDQNNLQVLDAGVTTRLQKKGYYEFDANSPEVMVYKGKADVENAGHDGEEVKAHHELALANGDGHAKASSFDAGKSEDDLYQWSRLRSEYLAEANNQIAGEGYYGAGYGPGWYWNPYGMGYTFMGGGPLFSPFGWGFYPLGWGFGGGWGWPGWYGGPMYGRGYYRMGDGHVRGGEHFRDGGLRATPRMGSIHGSVGVGMHGGMHR